MDLSTLSLDELKQALADKRAEAASILDSEDITDEQLEQVESLSAEVDAHETEISARETAEAERASRLSAAREKFTKAEEEAPANETEVAAATQEETPAEPEVPTDEAVTAAGAAKRLATRRPQRPAAPVVEEPTSNFTILAAPETGFAVGSELDGATQIGEALIQRLSGMGRPNGTGQMEKYSVANIRVDYPEELLVGRNTDAMEVAAFAAKEDRLPGGSLVAAGGWCAPSETVYGLCEGESLDGILSLPEMGIQRGGINFTKGPQFSDFYGNAFKQTEAEAIAGETKDCYEIECPDFTEVRLDAVGLCIKVPILTAAGYPELIRRVTSGSMTAFEHWKNADVIQRIVTLTGTARTVTGLGATVTDSLEALELVADQRRQQWRLPLNQALEVILPFWVKGAFRSDLARRVGVAAEAITDAMIMAHFGARNLAVQFVYDWQPLAAGANAYPETFQALVYPSGTFVKGAADVINLSGVYDAASLAVNTYTGLFMEQGLLVAEMCYDSDLLTLPICNAGRTGANDLTCAETP